MERDTQRSGDGKPWAVLVAAFLGWMFDGLEMGIFPLVGRPALQDLLGAKAADSVGAWFGIITALFLVGAACGGLLFGWLGDRIGRVRAMTWSILTYSIFTGLCYFAMDPLQLGVLRFVASLGMGGEWTLGVALVMECWPEKYRPILAAAIGAAANMGFGMIALLGRFIPVTVNSWRWVMLAGAVPALLTFFIRLFVPESGKWKAATLENAAKPVREIFGPELWKTTWLGIAFASIALIGTWGSVQWLPSWADQLAGVANPRAKADTQAISALGATIGSFLGAILGLKVKRRESFFLLSLGSLVVCGVLFRTVTAYGTEFLALTCLAGCWTASFYGWLPLYLPELFPTRSRATGQGVCYNFGRIFAAAGALNTGVLIQNVYHGNYARAGATMSLIYVFGLALIWLAPETKDKPLPE